MNKSELRKAFLQKRDNWDEKELKMWSLEIGQKLLAHPKFQVARKVLFYANKGSEVETLFLIEESIKLGKEVYLPKVEGKELRIYGTRGLGDLEEGVFGVFEPTSGKEIAPTELDLLIVPGIVFDQTGYRIGYGKGYYDRLLKKTGAYTIGLAYQFQLVENLVHEEHDVAVNEIIINH